MEAVAGSKANGRICSQGATSEKRGNNRSMHRCHSHNASRGLALTTDAVAAAVRAPFGWDSRLSHVCKVCHRQGPAPRRVKKCYSRKTWAASLHTGSACSHAIWRASSPRANPAPVRAHAKRATMSGSCQIRERGASICSWHRTCDSRVAEMLQHRWATAHVCFGGRQRKREEISRAFGIYREKQAHAHILKHDARGLAAAMPGMHRPNILRRSRRFLLFLPVSMCEAWARAQQCDV